MLNSVERAFIEALECYLAETLHGNIFINAFKCPSNLPAFIRAMYNFYEIRITGIRCIMLTARQGVATPTQVAKHVDLVRTSLDAIVIFAMPFLSAYNRARFITHRVAFVVPGNQLYIPELAADLREHFRAPKEQATDSLSPAAQAVLFHYILRIDMADTPSVLAKTLHYSAMSIGRAFDDLVAFELAHVEKHGKERRICFDPNRRDLFRKALDALRTPVRSIKYVQNGISRTLKWAGESALSKLTDVSPPQREVFAVVASQWKAYVREHNLVEVEEYMADFSVETWSYDPSGLSETSTVDPLSLYIQFKDHQDERLAIAAESLLERILW